MCTTQIINWHRKVLNEQDIKGKDVIEIGSWNGNGSIRPDIMKFNPSSYIGIDIMPQDIYVDVVCSALDCLNRFGPNSFDLVVSEEMLEHVFDWRTVINNMKSLCRTNGIILLTARSIGYPYHGEKDWFGDYWRFQKEDMENIFSDFNIINLEYESGNGGIFIKCQKLDDYVSNDLNNIVVYNTGLDQTEVVKLDSYRR